MTIINQEVCPPAPRRWETMANKLKEAQRILAHIEVEGQDSQHIANILDDYLGQMIQHEQLKEAECR